MSEERAPYGVKQHKFKEGDTVQCVIKQMVVNAVIVRCRPILADDPTPYYDIQSEVGDIFSIAEDMIITPEYGISYIASAPKAGDTIDIHVDYSKKFDGTTTIEPIPANVQRFRAITQRMTEVYAAKNADYGDSFNQGCDRLGYPYALGRIFDKYSRAENLLKGAEQKVADETVIDTLTDMSVYCILLRMYLEKKSL